jgi:hypothetical protein
MQLPKSIRLGHFEIFIKELDPDIAAASNEEGSFHSTTRTIWIDKSIIEKGGADLVCVLIHELMHVSYLKNNFNQTSSEEDLVNGFSNDLTELLSRDELLNIINKILRGKIGKHRPKK